MASLTVYILVFIISGQPPFLLSIHQTEDACEARKADIIRDLGNQLIRYDGRLACLEKEVW